MAELFRSTGPERFVSVDATVMDEMQVRFERSGDAAAIHAVLRSAFEGPDEARIVCDLRAAGAISSLVVAENTLNPEAEIVGALVFSPVLITDSRGVVTGAFGLGPMAVAPGHQRQGVGEAMFDLWWREGPHPDSGIVVVLGHPSYYPRFGFRPAIEFGVRWEHPCPDDAFMVLETVPGAAAEVEGVVSYHQAFR